MISSRGIKTHVLKWTKRRTGTTLTFVVHSPDRNAVVYINSKYKDCFNEDRNLAKTTQHININININTKVCCCD